jgi:peptidoglycan/LPS O-acetylase OafA/YrhL
MQRSHPFVDWMKAIGLILIVYGHVAHASAVWIAPPIYLKQFGVAFFVFASGFTLARESRPVWQVVYQRLFEVCLFGIACAAIISVTGEVTRHGLQLSNYLPFVVGANVLVNAFPANPTTWYIGTYIHLLLLWALVLRRITVGPRLLIGVLAAEVLIRALLLTAAGAFVAYMALSNWITVLLLGMACGQRHVAEPSPRPRCTVALAAFIVAWALVMQRIGPLPTFPLMSFALPAAANALLVSVCVSALYLTVTWLAYESLNGAVPSRVMQLVARNSVIVFIAHMPLYYATAPWVEGLAPSYWPRVAVRLLLCLVALTFASEGVHRLVAVRQLRDRIASMVVERAARIRAPRAYMREA